jgi:diazepam-binding inhibitor (GABA receptor modulating acyl-CoA-binding protein)
MALKEDFVACTERVQTLKTKPSTDELLELYALFKQATSGDVSSARPGIFDIKGRKKFDAWASKKGTTSDAAMAAYVALVNNLVAKQH